MAPVPIQLIEMPSLMLRSPSRTLQPLHLFLQEGGSATRKALPDFLPASTSMSVVFPAPELPTRAVKTPGWKAPLQSPSRRSMVTPSTTAARGPTFSGSVVFTACWADQPSLQDVGCRIAVYDPSREDDHRYHGSGEVMYELLTARSFSAQTWSKQDHGPQRYLYITCAFEIETLVENL